MYSLQFPNFTSYDYTVGMCDRDHTITNSPVFAFLEYGKLSEIVVATPSYSTQSIEASGRNRYLDEVIINPIAPISLTSSLAVDATLVFTNPLIGSGTSSNEAAATISVVSGVATITGVAAGNAIITISDSSNNLMYTINITVAA